MLSFHLTYSCIASLALTRLALSTSVLTRKFYSKIINHFLHLFNYCVHLRHVKRSCLTTDAQLRVGIWGFALL